jgi:hypothetical protein
MSYDELDKPTPPEASPEAGGHRLPGQRQSAAGLRADDASAGTHARELPHCKQFALLLPSPFENPDLKTCVFPSADHVSRSYDDALHSCQIAMKGRATL